MRSDENILQRLDAPTKAPSWPVGSEGSYLADRKLSLMSAVFPLYINILGFDVMVFVALCLLLLAN